MASFYDLATHGVCKRCGALLRDPDCLCESRITDPCPRCGGILILGMEAHSRATDDRDLLICSHCGTDEANYGYESADQIAPEDWPVASVSVRDRLYGDWQIIETTPLDAEMIILVSDEATRRQEDD